MAGSKKSMNDTNKPIGIRIRDRPECSVVPQPTAQKACYPNGVVLRITSSQQMSDEYKNWGGEPFLTVALGRIF